MKTREFMSPTVECVGAGAMLSEAARKMAERDVGALPVIRDGEPVGLVTDRDIVARAVAHGRNPTETPVSAVMSRDLVWCESDEDLSDVIERMTTAQVRRMLVRDSRGRLNGILSVGDLATGPEDGGRRAGHVLAAVCS